MTGTVLQIEDNEQNRYLATFLLERSGYTVVSVPDGMQGIAYAEQATPMLILLDIQLPHMDGYDVAMHLRRIDALRDVPIIAVTSYAMAGDRERALASGCTGYIEKPIDPETFVAQIEAVVQRKAGPPGVAE